MAWTPATQTLALAVLVVVYYGRVVRLVGEPLNASVVGALLDNARVARRWSLADLDGVVRLLLAGAMQAAFLVGLVALLPVTWAEALPSRLDWRLLLLGVPLGIAEAGCSTQVAYWASRVAERLRPGSAPTSVEGWLSVARGGWIRYYLRTAAVAPTWLLLAATILYVGGEEVLFRAVVLEASAAPGPALAVLVSVALFVTAQVFYTPGWQTALFPVVGAVVVGVVHGCLYLVVPDVTPLVVAHVTMFLVTVL
ncbi:MAG TPA: CPBP family glutamic-type intramembrane protease [Egibacteraceae bacterium]